MVINTVEMNRLVENLTPFFIGAAALYMIFIVWNIARESKAGRYGTIWMFIALCAGMVSYYSKVVIEFVMTHYHMV